MKLRTFAVLSLSTTTLILTSCKKEQPAAPAPAPAPQAAPAAKADVDAPKSAGTKVAATAAKSDQIYAPEEAKDHIGETATVKGKVFGVHITAKGDAFINVGAAYPNAPFTAVCFQSAIPADDLKALDGKTVSFSGKIKEHQGKAEIILNDANQINSDGGKPAAPKAAAPKADAPAAEAPKVEAPAEAAPKADDRPN